MLAAGAVVEAMDAIVGQCLRTPFEVVVLLEEGRGAAALYGALGLPFRALIELTEPAEIAVVGVEEKDVDLGERRPLRRPFSCSCFSARTLALRKALRLPLL